MFAAELDKLTKKLKRMVKKKVFEGKHIYLFGAGDNTRQIIKKLRENGFEPAGVVDNDINKQGSFCCGVKVSPANEVSFCIDNIFLIYSYFWQEMRQQLIDSGNEKKQIFILSEKDKYLIAHLIYAIKGKKIYDSLRKEYGNVPIFLCPYTGTGDIYLIGTFWKSYIKYHNIEDFVFVVISRACEKVTKLFDIKNVVVLNNQKESGYMIFYYNLCPNTVDIKILNDAWAQVNDSCTEWFRGYKGNNFTELFRRWVFELPDDVKPEHPVFKNEQKRLDHIFLEYGLKDNKTVVLSPYSNTLADLPITFWEIICEGLLNKGYSVVTNSSGKSEPAIKGSKGVFFPLDIAPQFIERAGGFIGVRSGFCDIVSGTKAKKVILYDAGNRFYIGSAFDYFNLKNMGLSSDAIEIQFKYTELNSTIEYILYQF